MNIEWVTRDLDALENLSVEMIVCPIWENVLPPKYVIDLCDWRYAGWISKLLLQGKITAKAGECTLIPGPPIFFCNSLLIFGMGPADIESKQAEILLSKLCDHIDQFHSIAFAFDVDALFYKFSPSIRSEFAKIMNHWLLTLPNNCKVWLIAEIEIREFLLKEMETMRRLQGVKY